ncbi:gamma-tubulin complex component 4-like protein [Senna tora]|uniref:Gamma-tubulin complex component n=1 Tax=Senna tora TaxID=362788 RepID=A0A834WIE2_9FABA|nr:gamma-tubulin complex component 4-like protein [Senna tora]
MPIGPEFNPVAAIGTLNRPEVVKRPGVIIKPIEFEDSHENPERNEGKHNFKKIPSFQYLGRQGSLRDNLYSLTPYKSFLYVDSKSILDYRIPMINREQLSSDSPISEECTFRLASDVSFIEPSDRELIERIITLGFYYRELDRFATKSRNLSWIRSANAYPLVSISETSKGKAEKPSVYRRALANGIVEILSIYRSAVLHIEQKLLSETMPILATITQGLNKFFVLLPPLYELILEIERDNIRGGQLLNLLHKRCHCGVPELQTCIKRQEDRDTELGSSPPDVSEKLAQLSTDDATLTDWHLGFHISLEMLPEYIPMHIAESVLFAGKAVRVLRNPSPAFQSGDAVYHQIPKSFQKIQGLAGRFPFQKESVKSSGLGGEDLLPQSEADKIEAMLLDLKESSEFHKRSFEYAVDSIQAVAASHLWQLVVVRADLNGHLKALKDYFLLAKGDFFQCFLEESRQLMRLPPRLSTAEADLMVPFQLAAIKTIGDEDKYFSKVSLRMPSFGITVKSSQLPKATSYADGSSGAALSKASSEQLPDGWDSITLEYSVDWPLHLFFTQEVLSMYRRVFQYLLRLKRTQMELDKLWASGMHQDHSDFAKHRNGRSKGSISQQRRQRIQPMWHVREHMAFLIRNLQFYIQVDVIELQWNILQTHIQESHDFTELVGFHQEYLAALISQSFLDIGSVSRILDSIMKLCLQFCWKIENQDSCSNTSELEHIAEEFNKKSNSLYTILRSSRLAGSQRAPFLRRFLLRLNLNSFFEATAKGVLNIVRPRPALPVLNQE